MTDAKSPEEFVLILIVLDDALREGPIHQHPRARSPVLILIVLDDALRAAAKHYLHKGWRGLNPYCTG